MSPRTRSCLTRRTLIALLLAGPLAAYASSEPELEAILAMQQAPPGVVFEVVSGDESKLKRLTPTIKQYAVRLRRRFPQLEIALVTHGAEQFSLLTSNAEDYGGLHREIKALIEDDKVPVHVCGNHASWRNNTAQDFPKYVDVAPSAGGQVRHYEDRGFVLVVL